MIIGKIFISIKRFSPMNVFTPTPLYMIWMGKIKEICGNE